MKPIREMTALDLLELHCQALKAQNEQMRAALQKALNVWHNYRITDTDTERSIEAEIRALLSGDGSVSQP